jgi:hypothetical protein
VHRRSCAHPRGASRDSRADREFEKADAAAHNTVAKLLERIARYEQGARVRRRKVVRALKEAGGGGAEL